MGAGPHGKGAGRQTDTCKGDEVMAKFEPSREVLSGETADVYFHRTIDMLRHENLNPPAVMELFPCRDGVLCGIEEVTALLQKVLPVIESGIWSLEEGADMSR